MISYDMPESEYRALPGFGSTDLKNALRSYHHMMAARQTFHETPALRFGRAFHCAVLEPERYSKEYVVMPEFSGKGCREKKEHWIMEHADRQAMTQDDADTIRDMERSIRRHDAAFNLLLDAKHREMSLTWELGSIAMKARLDAVTNFTIIDLKTTTDASPEGFGRQVAQLNYLVQVAHYLEGMKVNHEKYLRPDRFTFIAVEKEPPYGVGVYEVEADQLSIGQLMRDRAILNLDQRSSLKTTPYSPIVQPLRLPAWAYRGLD